MSKEQTNNNIHFPWKAFISLCVSIELYSIYELLGVHTPKIFDYILGPVALIVVAIFLIPGAAFFALIYNWFSIKSYKYCFLLTYKIILYINSFLFIGALVSAISISIFISDDFKTFLDEPVVYKIKTKHIPSTDIAVLEKRLKVILPSRYSRFNIDITNQTITFFRGEPDKDTVKHISENQGEISIYGKHYNKSLLNNSHIVSASPKLGRDEKQELSLKFTLEGSNQMTKYTRGRTGATIFTEMDGRIISEGTITNTLGSFIIISLNDGLTAKNYSMLLNSGPLSKKIILHQIK